MAYTIHNIQILQLFIFFTSLSFFVCQCELSSYYYCELELLFSLPQYGSRTFICLLLVSYGGVECWNSILPDSNGMRSVVRPNIYALLRINYNSEVILCLDWWPSISMMSYPKWIKAPSKNIKSTAFLFVSHFHFPHWIRNYRSAIGHMQFVKMTFVDAKTRINHMRITHCTCKWNNNNKAC